MGHHSGMDDDNGSLGKIPAEFISRALDRMPDPQAFLPAAAP